MRGLAPSGLIRAPWFAVLAVAMAASPAWGLQARPYEAAVLDADATSGVTATAIRFAAGSMNDPRGEEGTAAFLSRVLESQLTAAVTSVGAGIQVEAAPDWMAVTLVAPNGAWPEAARRMVDALYSQALDADEVERARADLLQILVFEAGAPVRDFEVELARFLYGDLDDHTRRSLGTPATVGSIQIAALEAFRSANLTPGNAVVAVSGPTDRVAVERIFGTGFEVMGGGTGGGTPPSPTPAAPGNVPPPPRLELYRTGPSELEVPGAAGAAWAWDSADREVVDRNITSMWISVATPLPRGAPHILSEFLAHLVIEDLTPSPPDPGLYDASVEIVEIGDAPVLVVTASVDPRVTERWGDRLYTVVGRMAAQPPEGAFFELTRRRFRSELVLELAVPENRARWLARQMAAQGNAVSSPEGGVWSVSREAVSALAEASGPSRILMYGPAFMMPQN